MINDPVYINQIIDFVQCLMIAKCICTYVYLNYSKTKNVYTDSKKRLAYIFLFHNSVMACVYTEEYSTVSHCVLFRTVTVSTLKYFGVVHENKSARLEFKTSKMR